MRASRLVSALMLLQARQAVTARELADELGVSLRTVYRDMESLQLAGVPIYAEPGRSGGYRLVEGYRTRLTGLTVEEAHALFLTGLPAAADALGLGAVAAAAARKLHAALPSDLRERATAVQDRFHLDAPGWFDDTDSPTNLAAVAAAVWQARRITVMYRRWREPRVVRRRLEPLGVVLKGGRWYLVARPDDGGAPRTYRVAEILTIESVDEPFERPAGFDLAAHWRTQTDGFRERLVQGTATVRLSARGLARMREVWSGVALAAVAETATPPDRRDRVTARVPIESLDHAETEMLKLGAEVEVIEPGELPNRLAEGARRMAATYGARRA